MSTQRTAPQGTESRPDEIPAEWLAEFEAAARRPLRTRFRYAFIRTYEPVLDDYRRWCEENLPDWLASGRRIRGFGD